MKKLNKEDIKVGDKVLAYVEVVRIVESINGEKYFLTDGAVGDVYQEDSWIAFDKEECKSLNDRTLLLIEYKDGSSETITAHWLNRGSFIKDSIIAYQIITPYQHSRRKMVVKDSLELHKLIIEHGKLYFNDNPDSKLYASFVDDGFRMIDERDGTNICLHCWDKKEWWVE